MSVPPSQYIGTFFETPRQFVDQARHLLEVAATRMSKVVQEAESSQAKARAANETMDAAMACIGMAMARTKQAVAETRKVRK